MTTGARITLLAVGVVIAIVAFIALKPDDDKKTSTTASSTPTTATSTAPGKPAKPAPPPVTQIVVKDAKPVGGIKTITVNKGDKIQFAVKSDVSDEIHV